MRPRSGRTRLHGVSLAALVIVLPLCWIPSFASRIRAVNLEEMTDRAANIFSGRCVSVRVAHDSELDRPVTYVTFTVQRSVKGNARGTLTIKLLGEQEGSAEERRGIEGLPRFQRGEEVVLFLYGESRSGLTSPVGFGQGKFTLIKDKQGQRLAVNGSGNANLLRRLSPDAERRLGLAASRWRGRRGIPPDALLDMAVSLGE